MQTGNVSSPLFPPRLKQQPFTTQSSVNFPKTTQHIKVKLPRGIPPYLFLSNNIQDGGKGEGGVSLSSEEALLMNLTGQLFYRTHIFPLQHTGVSNVPNNFINIFIPV